MAQIDRTCGAPEHHRAGLQVLRRSARVVVGVEGTLGDGDIAGGRNELGELRVGHLELLHPEPVDADLPRGPFLGVVVVGSNHGGLRRDPDEIVRHGVTALVETAQIVELHEFAISA